MTQLLPPKKEVALALLEKSNVDVYLDPRAKGVVVPPQFLREPRLILKIGLNMPVPIHNLHLDDETLACTLSFSRTPFYCVVPWGSVFAMVGEDGRGMVWPDDVPQELAVRVVEDRPPAQLEAVESKPASAPASSGRGRGKKQAAAAPEAAAPTPPAAEAKRGKKSKKSAKNEGAKDKKEERPRPVLVAVPPAAPSEPELTRIPAARPDRQRVAKEAPRAPATVPQRAPTPSRPKRELPPYLRVVK